MRVVKNNTEPVIDVADVGYTHFYIFLYDDGYQTMPYLLWDISDRGYNFVGILLDFKLPAVATKSLSSLYELNLEGETLPEVLNILVTKMDDIEVHAFPTLAEAIDFAKKVCDP